MSERRSASRSRTGRLIVISGPSGVGKTTICNALLERPVFRRAVTSTSRPPRPGERDGIDYRFLSPEEFLEAVRRGEFLEHATVHGHLYGTPRDGVEAGLREGLWVLLNIDVQGARQIREKVKAGEPIPLTQVFLVPPSMEELQRRLGARGTEDPRSVRQRLAVALAEMEERAHYEHVIVNDEVGATVRRILAALGLSEPGGGPSGGGHPGPG